MPVVEVKMLKGRTPQQKKEVIEGITEVMRSKAGAKPEHTIVIISDVEKTDYGEAGKQMG